MTFDLQKLDLMRYARPKPPGPEEKIYGTFNRRMIAASLDSLLITAIIAPIVDYFFIQAYGMPTADIQAIAQQAAEQTNSADAIRIFMEGLQSSGHLERWSMNMRWQFYAFAIYTTICWHYWSATPGKILCRLKVVDAKTHGRMGDWQSILRVVGYIVSALPFGAGFFWIGLSKKRRGWHDYLAGTEVILVPKNKATSTLEVDHPSSSQAPSEAE